MEEIGHLQFRAIRRRDLLTVRDAIAEARGHGAANTFIRSVSAAFGWAVGRDRLENNPAHRIKLLAGSHHRTWTPAEAERALEALPEHLRRVVILALFTGQRRGDLCAMPWSAYDGCAIAVVQEKTGASLVIPCHLSLQAELDLWREPGSGGPILRNSRGRPWTADHLSRDLSHSLWRIGLPRGLNVHGLRRLAAVNLANAGSTPHEIASITGHQSLRMVQEYTLGADQARLARSAVEKLSNVTKITNAEKVQS
jgi:integrase